MARSHLSAGGHISKELQFLYPKEQTPHNNNMLRGNTIGNEGKTIYSCANRQQLAFATGTNLLSSVGLLGKFIQKTLNEFHDRAFAVFS